MRRLTALTLTTAVLIGSGLALAPAASAKDADDRERTRGACTDTSFFKAELETDDGQIETEFTVKSQVPGQRWTYTLTQNGTVVATSTRTARADDDDDDRFDDSPSPRHLAEVDWDRDRPNTSGRDTFVMRAVNTATGEVCTVTASI